VLSLWVLWYFSRPEMDLFEAATPIVLLGACGFIWFLRLSSRAVLREELSRWWAVAPIGGVLLAVLVFTNAPLQARFTLAQGGLDDVARTVLAAPDPAADAAQRGDLGRVGTYRVHEVAVADGVVFFLLSHGNLWDDDTGIAYVPPPTPVPPSRPGGHHLHHLRGPWYTWTQPSNDD